MKPIIYVANISEDMIGGGFENSEIYKRLSELAKAKAPSL